MKSPQWSIPLALALFAASCGNGGSVSNGADSGGGDGGGEEAAMDSNGPCGDLEQMCCTSKMCNAGLACEDVVIGGSAVNRCSHCGDKDEPCCPGLKCAVGLACGVPLAPAMKSFPLVDGPRCREVPDSGFCVDSCVQPGGQYCGRIGNCRMVVDCGACAQPGFTCGGTGIHSVCGAASDSGACHPTVCEEANGRYCGLVGDGCGSSVDCGDCPSGEACGGSGVPNVCGEPRDGSLPRDPPPPLPPPSPPPPNVP